MIAELPELTEYSTDVGTEIPDTAELLSRVNAAMKGCFGADLSMDAETSAGRIAEAIALAFKNASGVNAQSMSQFSKQYLSGAFLDALASFFGVARIPANATPMTFGIFSTSPAFLSNGTVLSDPRGNLYIVACHSSPSIDSGISLDIGGRYGIASATSKTWSAADSISMPNADIDVGDTYYDSSGNGSGVMQMIAIGNGSDPALESERTSLSIVSAGEGSIAASTVFYLKNYSYASSDVSGESDLSLRTRLVEAMSPDSSSCEGIANAILKAVPSLTSVRVVANNSTSAKEMYGVSIPQGSVLICACGLRPTGMNDTTTDTDKRNSIARAIFNTFPCGISYPESLIPLDDGWFIDGVTDPNYDQEANITNYYRSNTIHVTDEASGLRYKVLFFEPKWRQVKVRVRVFLNGYSGTDIKGDIERSINQFFAGRFTDTRSTDLERRISSDIKGVFVKRIDIMNYPGGDSIEEPITPTILEEIHMMNFEFNAEAL